MYKGYENSFQPKTICPFCNKPTRKQLISVLNSLVYHPIIYDEDGNLITPDIQDNNQYTWQCLECNKIFVTKDFKNE
jgi:ribosomal protein L37AE/L43A